MSVTQHGVEGGAAVAEKRLDFAYNDAGQIVSIDRYLGDQLAVRADYSYDSLDRMIGLVYHQGDTVLNSYQWTYSGDGQSVGWVASPTANDVWQPNGGLPAEYVEQGMLPVHDTTGVTAALMEGGYAELSRLVSCTSTDGTATYSYDAVGQLTGADYDYQADESYTYDANGNRTGDGYIIGPDNRLLSDGVYWYTYDAEGNRTARFIDVDGSESLTMGDTEVTEYQWDARNRLTKVTDYEIYGGDPTQVVDYLYDLENRWIGKSIDYDGDGVFDYREGYVYDGNQMVLQFERGLSQFSGTENGTVPLTSADLTHRYLWQPDAVDQLMADEEITHDSTGNVATDDVVWALADQLVTVRDLAVHDAETGETAVVNHRVYDAYGNLLSAVDPATGQAAAVDCLFGFTGRAFDANTQIQNNLNRWYDANTGRWLSKDPIGFEGRDANPYRYVGNDPINATDPSGLWDSKVHIWMTFWLTGFAKMKVQPAYTMARAANFPDEDWRSPTHAWCSYQAGLIPEERMREIASWHFPQSPDGVVHKGSAAARRNYKDALDPKKTIGLSDKEILVMFGEGLHVLQDSYAHDGVPVTAGVGHAKGSFYLPGVGEVPYAYGITALSSSADDVSKFYNEARQAGLETWKAIKELWAARPDLFEEPMPTGAAMTKLDGDVWKWLVEHFPNQNDQN